MQAEYFFSFFCVFKVLFLNISKTYSDSECHLSKETNTMHIIQMAQEQHAIYFGYAFFRRFRQIYRNRKGLKCDKATQLSLIFRKLRKCSCVRMGVGQQILVLGCEMSHLLTRTTMSVIVNKHGKVQSHMLQGMYICSNQGQSWSAMTLDLAHAIIFLYFCIKIKDNISEFDFF